MAQEEQVRSHNIPVKDFTMMQVRAEVAKFIISNKRGVLVVDVPTGGGKTYGLPWIIKNDVIPALPETRVIMLEVLRTVTEEVRKNLRDDVLEEPVGMRMGRDEGANYRGERFVIGTTGASFQVVREGKWSVVILDEFDLDQNGDVAIMHNQLWHMLKNAEARDERLIVILPSATPDLVNAQKFYREFTFEELKVDDRMFDPDILEVDLGSSGATTFKNILDQYVRVLVQLCGTGYQGWQIPVGKNVLCTVPSPTYFEELEQKILEGVDREKVEVVKVWSRSTAEEKRKLFTGGTRGLTTIFIATDLIRRGGTPEIFAAFPSGWQVRDYCDPLSGLGGTREERTSEADYRQDEGRASRKERGLVIRSHDLRRLIVSPTFLERKSLEIFLLNLIYHEDVRDFQWWGEIGKEKISGALKQLEHFGAVEQQSDGRYVLTSRGRAMRGLSGSLRMRAMVFDADQAGVLPHFMIITAGISVEGGIFANAKGRAEIEAAQKSLRCPTSDWLSVLRVWGVITDAIGSSVDRVLAETDARVDFEKESACKASAGFEESVRSNARLNKEQKQSRVLELREMLRERLSLIEISRRSRREDAIFALVARASSSIAFENGLYKKGIEAFVKTVVQSAAFLNGKQYQVNGSPERTIEINGFDLLRMGSHVISQEEAYSGVLIHKVILGGHAEEFLFENVFYKGGMGYFYRKFGTESGGLGIFPGSSTFETKKMYLIGVPVDHKGKLFLENVVMISSNELAEWLPEVAPGLVRKETGIDPVYDEAKDTCVSTTRVFFGKKQMGEDQRIESPDHTEASRMFAKWLAAQIG